MQALKQINQSPRRTGHSIVFGLGVALGCLGGSWNSSAQNYPTKPVRILVGFIPGGGSDFIARFLAQGLTESFGKTFIVDNRPGAGAAIGLESGARWLHTAFSQCWAHGNFARLIRKNELRPPERF